MGPDEEKAIRLFERNARVVDKVQHIMDKEILATLKEILIELQNMNRPTKAGRPKKTE